MYISYDYYRVFYYVARYRSFTQAANILLNNQPNVTRTIKNLERELGCTLFVRSSRGVSLTPEGETLYAHVRIAAEHIQEGEQELLLDRGLQSGVVSIGASEVALHCLLLPVLKQFRELYPGIRLRVSNYSTPQAVDALKNGLVDFAVVTTPADTSPQMRLSVLRTLREQAICGPAFAHLAGRKIFLAELAQYPVICLGTQTKTYALYHDWFLQHHLTLAPDIEAATADQILPMVKNNLGIGFVPEEFLKNETEGEGIRRLQLAEEVPERAICLIRHTEHPLSIAAAKLEQMLLEKERTS